MIKKILVPLDGSKLAENALPYAETFVEKLAAELILTWVLHPLIVMSDYGVSAYETIIDLEEKEATEYLTLMQIKLQKRSLPVRTNILEGPVAQAIIDLACQERADLIVMSTHGRSGLSRWVYGSVATKVLEHAPCPVFLVKVKEAVC